MSASFVFIKQPREETTLGIDFSDAREIQSGETLTSATMDVTQAGLPYDDILVSHTIAGSRVLFRVRGGENGKDYKMTILVTTNTGHVREADVVMQVQER